MKTLPSTQFAIAKHLVPNLGVFLLTLSVNKLSISLLDFDSIPSVLPMIVIKVIKFKSLLLIVAIH